MQRRLTTMPARGGSQPTSAGRQPGSPPARPRANSAPPQPSPDHSPSVRQTGPGPPTRGMEPWTRPTRSPLARFPSRSEQRHRFVDHVQHILRVVQLRVAYVDTAQALASRLLSAAELAELQRRNRGKVIQERMRHEIGGYRVSVRLHQPTDEALTYWAKLRPKHLLTRFDVAYDFITATQTEAAVLEAEISRILTQPWRRAGMLMRYGGTTYLGRAWQPKGLTTYAGRTSKKTGEPCAHVELRFFTAAMCRRALRVRSPRLTDLLHLDATDLFLRYTRLSFVDLAKLDREIDAMTERALRQQEPQRRWTRDEMRCWIYNYLCRLVFVLTDWFAPVDPDNLSNVHAQQFVDGLHAMVRGRWMHSVPNGIVVSISSAPLLQAFPYTNAIRKHVHTQPVDPLL